MKKISVAFLALAAAFAATSCQNEDELPQQSSKPMVIKALAEGIGTGSRMVMAYKYDILWSESDQIYVTDGTSHDTFTLTDGEGTTEGTFTQDNATVFASDVTAYYPASMVATDGSLVWPAQQTASTTVPMYSTKTLGTTGTENFAFASLGSVLQIVFTTTKENVTLQSITIKDDAKPFSGAFTVSEDGLAVMADNADAPGITLDLGDGVPVGLAAKHFNIAVPAGTYSNLSITFTATDGTSCTLKGSTTINPNTVGRLALTGKVFKQPTKGKAAATGIGDVNWVQLWEDGPRWAEVNVGVTDGKAESYGGYYTWGGTVDGDPYDFCMDSELGEDYDTALQLWGTNWRMPTHGEFVDLVSNCTCTWTTQNDVYGLLFTGKDGYASNSIFLPAAGRDPSGFGVEMQGVWGQYWSSSTYTDPDFPESHLPYALGSYTDEYLDSSYVATSLLELSSVRAVLAE